MTARCPTCSSPVIERNGVLFSVIDRAFVEERDRYREALIPFAFAARGAMEKLGLGEEHDRAREALGLETTASGRARRPEEGE